MSDIEAEGRLSEAETERANRVLDDLTPPEVSSTWSAFERRTIVRAMLMYGDIVAATPAAPMPPWTPDARTVEWCAAYLDGYAGGHYMAQSCAGALRDLRPPVATDGPVSQSPESEHVDADVLGSGPVAADKARAREGVDDALSRLLIEDASTALAKDMATHIGDQVHAILKRQGMLMPTVSLAAAAGVVAARQILEEVILFARNSMEGDAEDEAAIEHGLRNLFGALTSTNQGDAGMVAQDGER